VRRRGEDGLDLSETERSLSVALDLLGADVVSDGCAATFSITGSTTRTSAVYYEFGECWTGSSTTASSTLTVDGIPEGTWHGEQVEPVPTQTSRCPAQDEPVNITFWDELTIAPLQQLYGSVGPMAANYDHGAWSEEVSPEASETFAVLLQARLAHDPDRPLGPEVGTGPVWQYLADWVAGAEDRGEDPVTYQRLIPQLIALLDCGDDCPTDEAGGDRGQAVQATLEAFQLLDGTNTEALSTQTEWWAWWEDVQAASADSGESGD